MLELLAGIQAVQRVTQNRLGADEPVRRRRPSPAPASRRGRRFVFDAVVALSVPVAARTSSRPRRPEGALRPD